MASPSNKVERALARIASELESVGQGYALVGGLAVSARAEPRTTPDVDIAIAIRSDEEAYNPRERHSSLSNFADSIADGIFETTLREPSQTPHGERHSRNVAVHEEGLEPPRVSPPEPKSFFGYRDGEK